MTAKGNKKNAVTTLLCATQFRKADYTNKKGEAKNKLALVTDRYAICELFRTLKATMIFFPQDIDTTLHTQKKFINEQSTTYVLVK